MNKALPLLITGMKHSGKSTTGSIIAEKLSADFFDLDDLIEDLYFRETEERLSARDIYRIGKNVFQDYESRAIRLLTKKNSFFITAAGGGICDNSAACKMLDCFLSIYIEEDAEVLYRRIIIGGVPAFLDEENPYRDFLRLYDTRSSKYKQLCDIRITASGRCPEAIVSEIIEKIG